VFAFGIGSSVNRYLIEGIARAGQGEPFVVTQPSEADAVAQRFRRYIEAPVLTEVSVHFDGFQAYDVEPATQPDLFAQRPVVVLGKWRGALRGEITVVGRTSTGPFEKRVTVAPSLSRPEHAALPRLWARSRIARLEDWNAEGNDHDVERQVTVLGLEYSLLTPYTSFIAVLEQVRTTEQATTVDQPLPLPLGVSEASAGEYEVGAEPPLGWLVLLGVLGAWVSAWLRKRRAGVLGL
jgi:Ca-activated chloride channel family protein